MAGDFLFSPFQELQSRRFWCCLLAEAAGTLIFVWVVLGASFPAGPKEVLPSPLQPALAAGLVAISLAHCFGEISGAQVNPALTVAFLCTRKLDALHAVSYILAQCLGAIMASGIFYFMLPTSAIRQLVTKVSKLPPCGPPHKIYRWMKMSSAPSHSQQRHGMTLVAAALCHDACGLPPE